MQLNQSQNSKNQQEKTRAKPNQYYKQAKTQTNKTTKTQNLDSFVNSSKCSKSIETLAKAPEAPQEQH